MTEIVVFSKIVLVLLTEVILKGHGKADALPYLNQYGDGYGVEWVYFPDGDGVPHVVNLSLSAADLAFVQSTDHRAEVQLEFRLYTRYNMEDYIVLGNTGKLLNGSALDASLLKKPIKMFAHGWRTTVDKSAASDFRNAYLEMQDVNFIAVDWSAVANNFYFIVAFQSRDVGIKIGEFLNALNKEYNVTGDQIHLIGHSLGAHIMGVAGEVTQLNISRITGLDPALPIFKDFLNSKATLLEASDAQYVDIIHTCGGLLGFMNPIGTADFYPNGGSAFQPGCEGSIQNLFEGCSHGRAHVFFVESIRNPRAFPAYICEEWSKDLETKCKRLGYMGESSNVTGNFFLLTNSKKPFGREGCSHGRAHVFFVESIRNPRAFPAYICEEWSKDLETKCKRLGYMGESSNVTGNFFLLTNSKKPFGRGV